MCDVMNIRMVNGNLAANVDLLMKRYCFILGFQINEYSKLYNDSYLAFKIDICDANITDKKILSSGTAYLTPYIMHYPKTQGRNVIISLKTTNGSCFQKLFNIPPFSLIQN